MKAVVRCANCNRITRRNYCYHVKLLGVINNSTMFEKPNWEDHQEKTWLCKGCATLAGYKVKENVQLNPTIKEETKKRAN